MGISHVLFPDPCPCGKTFFFDQEYSDQTGFIVHCPHFQFDAIPRRHSWGFFRDSRANFQPRNKEAKNTFRKKKKKERERERKEIAILNYIFQDYSFRITSIGKTGEKTDERERNSKDSPKKILMDSFAVIGGRSQNAGVFPGILS